MVNVEIIKIGLGEIEQLQNIGRKTFVETFASVNSEENMQKYLEESYSREILTTELTNPNAEFYFAKHGNTVLGYLKINLGLAQTENKNHNALEIERIYVLEEFQGRQVGQILFQTALNIAKDRDAEYLWLGVWEENAKAIKFYKKNGLVEFDKHIFRLGDDEQTDIMMKLIL